MRNRFGMLRSVLSTNSKKIVCITSTVLLSLIYCSNHPATSSSVSVGSTIKCDLAVYGATPSGIVSAITAAEKGLSVVLLAPDGHIGGMMTSGLSRSDIGNWRVIGGKAREFFARIGKYYLSQNEEMLSPGVRVIEDGEQTLVFDFEPRVAQKVLNEWLAEQGVKIVAGRHFTEVVVRKHKIKALTLEDGTKLVGKYFVDATYEGDLMAAAGVPYTVGREGTEKYGEPLAGLRPPLDWPFEVSGCDEDGNLAPHVIEKPDRRIGSGDSGVQAYNFRLIFSLDPSNQVKIKRPKNYDESSYVVLCNYFDAQRRNCAEEIASGSKNWGEPLGRYLSIFPIANNKFDVNSGAAIGTHMIGANHGYPEGSAEERKKIWQAHKDWAEGLLYFLLKSKKVPPRVRRELSRYGLAKDEFADTGNWPPLLYIREARRMVSDFVLTQADVQENLRKRDSIGLGSYKIDSKRVHRYVDKRGILHDEGGLYEPVRAYQIPYRIITPPRGSIRNLLVPVAVSASHVAFCSIRMEPQFMIMGQAAGLAAKLALKEKLPAQNVNVDTLRKILHEEGQVLDFRRRHQPYSVTIRVAPSRAASN